MGQQRDAVITAVSAADLFDALRGAWRALLNEVAPRSALVLLVAQSALEDAWWKACHGYNLGNQKARVGGAVDWQFYGCDEVLSEAEATHQIALDPAHAHIESRTANGQIAVWFDPPHPACAFTAYGSLAEGAAAWLKLQHDRFSHAWGALLSGDGRLFAAALRESGYFTAPLERYALALVSIAKTLDGELPDFEAADTVDPTSQGHGTSLAHDTEPAPASGTAA